MVKRGKAGWQKWLQVFIHAGAWLPIAYLVISALLNNLGFNPVETVMRFTGRAAVIFLLLSLTCTPAAQVFKLPWVKKFRKPLGLYAALYAGLHFAAFAIWDYGFNLPLIWSEIANKPFILLGLAALVILLVLAVTSFKTIQRKWGKGWVWLHRLVYAAALLVIAHYLLAVKGDLFSLQGAYTAPLIAAGVLLVVFLLRIPVIYRNLKKWWGRSSKPEPDLD